MGRAAGHHEGQDIPKYLCCRTNWPQHMLWLFLRELPIHEESLTSLSSIHNGFFNPETVLSIHWNPCLYSYIFLGREHFFCDHIPDCVESLSHVE